MCDAFSAHQGHRSSVLCRVALSQRADAYAVVLTAQRSSVSISSVYVQNHSRADPFLMPTPHISSNHTHS